MQGKFIYIDYYALRDKDGNYLGTLEFTQDLTRLRALEGEQRLLSYTGNREIMTNSKITISPKTKVGELLDAYPELEHVLMAMSPAFEKLKNPVLRKTVAKVATLQQVCIVGGVNIDEMIRILKKKRGSE